MRRSRTVLCRAVLALLLMVGWSAPALAQGRNNARMKEQLMETFDMSNAIIDVDALMAPGVGKDGIPALTNPETAPASAAEFPGMTDRVVTVAIGGQAVAFPIKILNWHEAVNTTIGGVPIVVTYCPLCDSAAAADRRVTTKAGKTLTLEFGISGFLYNSNMVMYDQTSMGIWSQVYLRAMTGPLAGTRLRTVPIRVDPFAKFIAAHPTGRVMTTNTGHERVYDRNPYRDYFADGERVFHQFGWRDDLPPKTLGAGVLAGDDAVFVSKAAVEANGGTMTVATPRGEVAVALTDAGFAFDRVPEGVDVMQVFWHSWSAFHPQTRVVASDGERQPGGDGGG